MERILDQKHNKETFYYSISRMLERASYYGVRTVLVLYMTGEILKMDSSQAFKIYGWAVTALMITRIIGAILGDLILGNKTTIIIGGIINAIGAFSLCIPSITGLYTGLFLVILGSGFFTPNIISCFGKLYLNKTKLLDSGFTLLYLAVNLGAFIGSFLIGYSGEKFGYNIGFTISGILMLLSIIPFLILKETSIKNSTESKFPISKRILKILTVFVLIGIFWAIYEISNIQILVLQLKFMEIPTIGIPKHMWQSFNAFFILPISIIAIVVWTYYYSSQIFKLILGFLLGTISLGILFFIPDIPTEKHIMIYFISIFFFALAEIHIAPVVHSVLTKYTNPKYLGILISLVFIPTKLISLIFGLFKDQFYENPELGLNFGLIIMLIISVGLILRRYLSFSSKY